MEHTVNVRIPANLWAHVQELAIKERRSATAQLAVIVERGLGIALGHRNDAPQAASSTEHRKRGRPRTTPRNDAPLSEAARRLIAKQEYFDKHGKYPEDD